MQSIQKQAGLSSLAWLSIIIVAVFMGLFLFKVGGAYIDNAFVVSSLKKLGKSEDVNQLSPSKIKANILSQFTIDGVNDKDIRGAIKISKTSKGKLITINYEKRTSFFRNIYLVVSFENELDTAKPDECCSPAK
ncbi:DUF4845 domain-containing protein [bacterium]|nr:DUF4845 domain-containing protein [bacterium]